MEKQNQTFAELSAHDKTSARSSFEKTFLLAW